MFPTEIKRTPIDDIPTLAPTQEIRIPLEILITSTGRQPIRVDVRSDKGSYVAVLNLEPWANVTSASFSLQEFKSAISGMGGFSESISTVTFSGEMTSSDIHIRVRRIVNVYPVQVDTESNINTDIMFAGIIRKAANTSMTQDKLLLILRRMR